jgi:hypothetical protein
LRRLDTVAFSATVTAAGGDADWLEINPADDKPVKLRGFLLSQVTEVGDTAEEGLRFSVIRLPATVTSGNGTATTAQPMSSTDAAAGAACETNSTTVATTSGTAVTLMELAWINRMSPYEWWAPDPAFAPLVKQGEALVIRMQTSLLDDMTACFTAWLEEEG